MLCTLNSWNHCYSVCLLAGVTRGQICSDKCTRYHTEIEVADQTCYLTQYSILTPGQSVPALTLHCQVSGRVNLWIPKLKSLIHEDGMWLPQWLNLKKKQQQKTVTYTKISPKMVNPRDIAGECRRRRSHWCDLTPENSGQSPAHLLSRQTPFHPTIEAVHVTEKVSSVKHSWQRFLFMGVWLWKYCRSRSKRNHFNDCFTVTTDV